MRIFDMCVVFCCLGMIGVASVDHFGAFDGAAITCAVWLMMTNRRIE
jgi:hypothetical protein